MTDIEAIARNLSAFIIFALLVVGVIALFFVGYKKLLADKPTSASAAMSFGFLLVVMLTISQFKHVKGFGFDAELWDQKQVEAARLVDQLKGLAQAASRELALVAAKIGLWDNGLTNRELMDLINTLDPVLKASEFDADQRANFLAPIYDRVAFNYTVAAYQSVYHAFQDQYKVPESNPCQSFRELPSPAAEYRIRLCALNETLYSNRKKPDLRPIISFVTEASSLDNRKGLLEELRVLEVDFMFFNENHRLKQ